MSEETLLRRSTTDSAIFGGKPIIRGHRPAVEHVLGMLAADDFPETILKRARVPRARGHPGLLDLRPTRGWP
jgi:uncharacterized protein (DUF433 family)